MLSFKWFFLLVDCFTFYGGGGSSSSSSSNHTTTTNVDKRLVVDNGVGVSSDSSTVNVNTQTLDLAMAQAALDYISAADAANGQNFKAMLDAGATGIDSLLSAATASGANSNSTLSAGFSQMLNATTTNNALSTGLLSQAMTGGQNGISSNAAGFDSLLKLAGEMFAGAGSMIGKAQDTTMAQVGQLTDAATTAANDKAGTVNQKTLIILAIAGVGALALSRK